MENGSNSRLLHAIIKGIRLPNLLLILLFHFLVYIKFFNESDPHIFFLLAASVLVFMAGANLENDLKDLYADRMNRKTNFYHVYRAEFLKILPYVLYGLSLFGFYIFLYRIKMTSWILYFISITILMINYNHILKKMPFLGNFIISLLSMIVIIQLLIFFPASMEAARILVLLGFIIFFVTLNREMLKDLEDRKGDRRAGYYTLATLSPDKTFKIIFFQSVVTLILLSVLILHLQNTYSVLFYVGVFLFQLFILMNLFKLKKSVKTLKNLHKWLIFMGIAGIAVL